MIVIAVFILEIPRGTTTSIIMKQAGYDQVRIWGHWRLIWVCPAGFFVIQLIPAYAFDPLIGFTAGIFLYIGASDLLPEAHRRFNKRVVFSTLLGAVTIPTLAILLR